MTITLIPKVRHLKNSPEFCRGTVLYRKKFKPITKDESIDILERNWSGKMK